MWNPSGHLSEILSKLCQTLSQIGEASMSAWFLIAFGFLAFSAFCLFGWPLLVYGAQALKMFRQRRVAQGLAGGLAIMLVLPVSVPLAPRLCRNILRAWAP